VRPVLIPLILQFSADNANGDVEQLMDVRMRVGDGLQDLLL